MTTGQGGSDCRLLAGMLIEIIGRRKVPQPTG
jgi:hypothetical protein